MSTGQKEVDEMFSKLTTVVALSLTLVGCTQTFVPVSQENWNRADAAQLDGKGGNQIIGVVSKTGAKIIHIGKSED